MLRAQANCEAKWMPFRSRFSPIRRGRRPARNSGQNAASDRRMTSARTLRTVRISKMLNVPTRPRMETAMAENDSSAPVIQRTTRPIEKGGTFCFR
jgi:hypothetical protein